MRQKSPADCLRKGILVSLLQSFFVILLPILLALGGCTFHMDENFVEVNNTPSVEITDAAVQSEDLLTLPDTFSLFARTTLLKYTLTIENQEVVVK